MAKKQAKADELAPLWADLKREIEEHVKKDAKSRHRTREYPLPKRYKFITMGDEGYG